MKSGLTEEQQAIRLTGVGASEAAAIVNRSRYASPYDIYQRKNGTAKKRSSSVLMRGNYLEGSILDWAEDELGEPLARQPGLGTLRHPKYPHVLATPDAILTLRPTPVQAKSHKFNVMDEYGEEGTDAIPDEELIQVTMEMGVLGADEAFLPVLFGGDVFRMYRVEFHPALFEHVATSIEAFWENHVAKNRPPEMNGAEYAKYLATLYARRVSNKVLEANEMATLELKTLLQIKEQIAELIEKKSASENYLRTIIGADYGVAAPGVGKALWVGGNEERTKVDWESLAFSLQKMIPPERGEEVKTLRDLYTTAGPSDRQLRTYADKESK
jgi:predicted phage-related endonuclease